MKSLKIAIIILSFFAPLKSDAAAFSSSIEGENYVASKSNKMVVWLEDGTKIKRKEATVQVHCLSLTRPLVIDFFTGNNNADFIDFVTKYWGPIKNKHVGKEISKDWKKRKRKLSRTKRQIRRKLFQKNLQNLLGITEDPLNTRKGEPLVNHGG